MTENTRPTLFRVSSQLLATDKENKQLSGTTTPVVETTLLLARPSKARPILSRSATTSAKASPAADACRTALQNMSLNSNTEESAPVESSPRRPSLARSVTFSSTNPQPPPRAKPILSRGHSTLSFAGDLARNPGSPPPGSKPAARPSILRRVTDSITVSLELKPTASSTYKNAPAPPTHWTDAAHLGTLLKIWDAVHEQSTDGRYAKSLTQQLVSAEKRMLQAFPELAEGELVLQDGSGRKWVEFVLGVSLRHPFCTAESMGRWEVLSGTGGTRGVWGPW